VEDKLLARPGRVVVELLERGGVILPIAALLIVWHPLGGAPAPSSTPGSTPAIAFASPPPSAATSVPAVTPSPTAGPSPSPVSPSSTSGSTPIAVTRSVPNTRAPARPVASPVLIGAGDICALSNIPGASATAALIKARPKDLVFTLGDNSFDSGTTADFTGCYARTWGAFVTRTRPAPGNHDYLTAGAGPYFSYFGARAGVKGKGYYSYNLANSWHVVVLNSMCSQVGGCGSGSPQERWLRADLATVKGRHILAMWHEASFSSGSHGNNSAFGAFWADLYAAHADVILNGNDSDYERFGLQSPSGHGSSAGIREFVVGTGGATSRSLGSVKPNSQVRIGGAYGVLELTLGAHSYGWKFIPAAGSRGADSGSQATHS
jgi:hypothetical protein